MRHLFLVENHQRLALQGTNAVYIIIEYLSIYIVQLYLFLFLLFIQLSVLI